VSHNEKHARGKTRNHTMYNIITSCHTHLTYCMRKGRASLCLRQAPSLQTFLGGTSHLH
jgi:hypothetical protein